MRTTTLDLFKEEMKFSAAHFTIFSASERENLHGHNFTVRVSLRTAVEQNGLCFDYGDCKRQIIAQCREWNETTLLPERSAHLKVTQDAGYVVATFGQERLLFLPRDVKLLPIENVTLEELSQLFMERLLERMPPDHKRQLQSMRVRVFSGPGQSASAEWRPT